MLCHDLSGWAALEELENHLLKLRQPRNHPATLNRTVLDRSTDEGTSMRLKSPVDDSSLTPSSPTATPDARTASRHRRGRNANDTPLDSPRTVFDA